MTYHLPVKEWPASEQPREKMAQLGAEHLSDAELLADRDGWPPLYDPARLASNEVPAAAAVYFNDMYVPAALSVRTAAAIRAFGAPSCPPQAPQCSLVLFAAGPRCLWKRCKDPFAMGGKGVRNLLHSQRFLTPFPPRLQVWARAASPAMMSR